MQVGSIRWNLHSVQVDQDVEAKPARSAGSTIICVSKNPCPAAMALPFPASGNHASRERMESGITQ